MLKSVKVKEKERQLGREETIPFDKHDPLALSPHAMI